MIGGSGFLGRRIVQLAQAAGHRVTATFHTNVPPTADVDWHCSTSGASPYAGVHHVAGTDAVSRYELGKLIAERDGLDPAALPTGLRATIGPPSPLDVRLDSTRTQA